MGILGKSLLFLFLFIVLLYLLMQVARAEIAVINMTISTDAQSIFINLSGSFYQFPVNNITYILQQNFSVSAQGSGNVTIYVNSTVYSNNTFFSNSTISNVTCSNSTLSVSCVCPLPNCPSVVTANCTVPNEVKLDNDTKTLFFNSYQTALQTKIEESSNKVTADLKFALEPTKVELEGYKQLAFNASVRQKEAEDVTAKCNANNLALTGVYNSCSLDRKLLEVFLVIFFVIVLAGIGAFFGPQAFDKFGKTGGGGLY